MSVSSSPHFLRFVLDEHRYELECMTQPAILEAFVSRLEEAHRLDFWGVVQDLNNGTILSVQEAKAEATTAEEVLRCVVEDGLMASMGLLPSPVLAAARALDAEVAGLPSPGPVYELNFVWDNGGGDDNVFSGLIHGTGRPDLVHAWAESLKQWLEEAGHGYDLSIGPMPTSLPELSLEDAVEDLVGTLNDNGQEAWGQALMDALTAPVTIKLDRPRRRLR